MTPSTEDWNNHRRMQRAARDCIIALDTGRPEEAITHRLSWLAYATRLRANGMDIGSMMEEAAGGYKGPRVAK